MEQKSQTTSTLQVRPSSVDACGEETGSDAVFEAQVIEPAYHQIRKSIHSWAWWLLGWAGYSALFGDNVPWAVVLSVMAWMSFFFADVAAMFIVYAGMLLWAATVNLLFAGDWVWASFGVIQLVLVITTCREYLRLRDVKADYAAQLAPDGAAAASVLTSREAIMPWVSLFLGGIGMVGLCSIIPAAIYFAYSGLGAVPPGFAMVLDSAWELGILALPVGAATIWSGHGSRAAAVIGIILGVVFAILELIVLAIGG